SLFVAVGSMSAVIGLRGASWDPARAARYLDSRQQEWFAWRQAQSPDGPCVSCHTGMPYLLARPALRALLKEAAPTMYDSGLGARLARPAGEKPKGALQGVETIMAALFLSDRETQRSPFSQLGSLSRPTARSKAGGSGTTPTSTRGRRRRNSGT